MIMLIKLFAMHAQVFFDNKNASCKLFYLVLVILFVNENKFHSNIIYHFENRNVNCHFVQFWQWNRIFMCFFNFMCEFQVVMLCKMFMARIFSRQFSQFFGANLFPAIFMIALEFRKKPEIISFDFNRLTIITNNGYNRTRQRQLR